MKAFVTLDWVRTTESSCSVAQLALEQELLTEREGYRFTQRS